MTTPATVDLGRRWRIDPTRLHLPWWAGRVTVLDAIVVTGDWLSLGTRWRETREVFGHLDTVEMEVIAFERDRSYTLSHYKAGVRVEIVFAFEPDRTGTRVTITFTLDGAGVPSGLLPPLNWAIAGKVRHVLNHDLADLKQCLERQAPTPQG